MKKVFLNKNSLNVIMLNTAYLNGGYKKKLSDVDENGYIKFKDPEVSRVIAENWGDGVGTTLEQIEAITNIGDKFKSNTLIERFNEFEKFKGLEKLGVQSFLDDTNLIEIKLPENMVSIDDSAFRGCSKLKSINLDNVKILGNSTTTGWTGVFHGCSELSDIGNTDKVETIFARTFYNCTSLEGELHFPSVVTMHGQPFAECANITKIHTPKWKGSANGTFYKCSNLEYVDTSLVTAMAPVGGMGVFAGCTKLKTVDLSSLKDTGTGIWSGSNFSGSAITSLNLPSIENVGDSGVRAANNIAYCVLGENITSIGNDAFFNCSKLEVFVCKAITPPTLGTNAFGNTNNCPIYVPDASVEAYKTATNWSDYASRIKPISEKPEPNFAITPPSTVVYNSIQLCGDYGREIKEATWSIVSGSEFGSITQDGLLTFNEGVADGSAIKVRAVAKENSEWVHEQTYTYSNTPIEHGVTLNNDGTTSADSSMSTVGFVPTNGATSIKWGVTGGQNGILCEYTEAEVKQDYWGGSKNPRTVNIKSSSTLVKASFSTAHLNYAYIMNAATGEYLWKGSKV